MEKMLPFRVCFFMGWLFGGFCASCRCDSLVFAIFVVFVVRTTWRRKEKRVYGFLTVEEKKDIFGWCFLIIVGFFGGFRPSCKNWVRWFRNSCVVKGDNLSGGKRRNWFSIFHSGGEQVLFRVCARVVFVKCGWGS